jgi:hypothetical protein
VRIQSGAKEVCANCGQAIEAVYLGADPERAPFWRHVHTSYYPCFRQSGTALDDLAGRPAPSSAFAIRRAIREIMSEWDLRSALLDSILDHHHDRAPGGVPSE